MEPNPKYSGPVKPKLDKFVQLPFTSGAAEFNALVGGKITVGYLPLEDITSPGEEPARARQEPPASRTSTSTRGTRGASTTSPQLQLDR